MLIDGRSDPNTAGPQTRLDVHPSASAAATTTTTAIVRRRLIVSEDSPDVHFHVSRTRQRLDNQLVDRR
jgi:hypothetical protein